jgi:hypothetical protein
MSVPGQQLFNRNCNQFTISVHNPMRYSDGCFFVSMFDKRLLVFTEKISKEMFVKLKIDDFTLKELHEDFFKINYAKLIHQDK